MCRGTTNCFQHFFSSEKCEVFWRLPAKCQVGRETEKRHYCFMVTSIPSESDWLTWAKRGRRDEVLSELLANGFCGGDATFIIVILRGTPIASKISACLCLRSKTHRRKRDLSTNFFGHLLLTDSGQRSGSWKDFQISKKANKIINYKVFNMILAYILGQICNSDVVPGQWSGGGGCREAWYIDYMTRWQRNEQRQMKPLNTGVSRKPVSHCQLEQWFRQSLNRDLSKHLVNWTMLLGQFILGC